MKQVSQDCEHIHCNTQTIVGTQTLSFGIFSHSHSMLARTFTRSRSLASAVRRALTTQDDEFKALKPIKPPVFLSGDNGATATDLYIDAVRADALETVVNQVEGLANGKYTKLDSFVDQLDFEKYSLNQLYSVVLQEALNNKLHQVSAQFYAGVVKKGSQSNLKGVNLSLQELFLVSKGYDIADVASAVELSAEEKESLSKALEKEHSKSGKKLHMRYTVKPSLLAGFTVQINENFWDFSIESQLKSSISV